MEKKKRCGKEWELFAHLSMTGRFPQTTDRFCQCVKLKTFSCTPSYAHCRANMNQRIETSMNRHTLCEGKNHKAPENCRKLIMQWTWTRPWDTAQLCRLCIM